MVWYFFQPLPREVVRDLLAIARMLYRQTATDNPQDIARLETLTAIGKDYRLALKKTARTSAGTIPHYEGWEAAERATKALGELVGDDVLLAPLFHATAKKAANMENHWSPFGKKDFKP